MRTIDSEVSPALFKSEIATSNNQVEFLTLVIIANTECCTDVLNSVLDSTDISGHFLQLLGLFDRLMKSEKVISPYFFYGKPYRFSN